MPLNVVEAEFFAGTDWASTTHTVRAQDSTGRRVAAFAVEHTAAGLAGLLRRLAGLGTGDAVTALVTVLRAVVTALQTLNRSVVAALGEHPDAENFTSLPHRPSHGHALPRHGPPSSITRPPARGLAFTVTMGYMASKLEVERKYELPEGFTLPDLTGVGGVTSVGEADDLRLDAVYYDTDALHLARGRVTLRRRTGGHDAGWHLKRPAGAERSELQVPASGRQTKPPATITRQVRALSRGAELRPVVRIRTHRVERALRAADGSTIALVADDEVTTESLRGDGTARQWHELEIELIDGGPDALAPLDAALRAAGARPAKTSSKLAQALGDEYPPPDGSTPNGSKARRALAAYLVAQRDTLIANDPGVRDGDPEAVHKMRVATRRLRSTLKSFKEYLPEAECLHEEVKWVTGLLGAVRDTDVMGERLAGLVAAEPVELVLGPVNARITSTLAARTAQARTALATGLDSPRYTTLLNDLDEFVAASAAGRINRRDLMHQARKALRRADDQLDSAANDEQRHESRKAFKRARYATELVEPLAGQRSKRLADALTELQDVLGSHQDAIVTGELLHQMAVAAHGSGENSFTFGLLHARADEHGRRALDDLPKVRRNARKAGRAIYN